MLCALCFFIHIGHAMLWLLHSMLCYIVGKMLVMLNSPFWIAEDFPQRAVSVTSGCHPFSRITCTGSVAASPWSLQSLNVNSWIWIADESGDDDTTFRNRNHHGANIVYCKDSELVVGWSQHITTHVLARFDHGTWSFVASILLGNRDKTTHSKEPQDCMICMAFVFCAYFWGSWFRGCFGYAASQDCLKSVSVSPTTWSQYQLCNSDLVLFGH